jgi:hypothetical protein
VLLQCTDLDGTLIEDGEEGDWVRQNDELTYLCAQHFAQYLAPAGGLIVFNTGRSIGTTHASGVAAVARMSPHRCSLLHYASHHLDDVGAFLAMHLCVGSWTCWPF